MSETIKKLSTDSYKGVRDFFPKDMAVQNRIFAIWRSICEKYGYEEYNASVLEPADLYRAKTGEEIVNEQTYTFTDRGEREVTLRPEMTPTLARMIAAKRRELQFPVRWFSIPNVFRYEQPQRGRLREHWQLNVDIFGVSTIGAETEVISMAYDIIRAYGLKDQEFEIRINNRAIMNYVTSKLFSLDEEKSHKISKLIDKKAKLDKQAFKASIQEVMTENSDKLITLLDSANLQEFVSNIGKPETDIPGITEIRDLLSGLERLGITNARFDQTLMRGFDYYTGTVFEIFDLNPENRRSVFGGGRYDDLLSIFGSDKVPAFGFGAGDVIARDLMETYDSEQEYKHPAEYAICIVDEKNTPYAFELAQRLRKKGLKVFLDLSSKKVGDQIGNAQKRGIPKVICIGDEEVMTGKLKVKELHSGNEIQVTEDEIK